MRYLFSGRWHWRTTLCHWRLVRQCDPPAAFDDRGHGIESWIGTNDNSFAGGEPSGTDNMVKTEAGEYDGGADGGNSYLTEVTRDADGNWGGTGDQRVTQAGWHRTP